MKRLDCFCPSETAAKLLCPERGFYTIIRYTADEVFRFPEGFSTDPGDTLFLVEINLKNYSSGLLSERALNGIDELFNRLRKHIPEITGEKGVSALPGFIKLNKNGKPDGLSKNDETVSWAVSATSA